MRRYGAIVSGSIITRLIIWTLCLVAGLGGPAAWAQTANEVFRVIIDQDIPLNEAQAYKLQIEGMGYVPVYLDIKGERATVQYGNFTSKREAEAAKAELARNKIRTFAVVKTKREVDSGGPRLTILAMSADKQAAAAQLKDKLEAEGNLDVKVRKQGTKYNVTVGDFGSENQAQNSLVNIRLGMPDAKIVKAEEAGAIVTVSATAADDPKSTAPAGKASSAAAFLQQEGVAAKLSEQQMAELVQLLEDKAKAAQSQVIPDAVRDRIIELEKKMAGLDVKVTGVLEQWDAQQAAARRAAEGQVKVLELMREADLIFRSGDINRAIDKAKEVLAIEPENQIAVMRIQTWEQMRDNPNVEVARDENYNRLKAQAIELANDPNEDNLRLAKNLWIQIKALDKAYEAEADQNLAQIQGKINALPKQGPAGPPVWLYGALGGVALFALVIAALVYMKVQKNQREIAAKIQEATSLRPMRGIPGGRRASDWMLTGPSAGPGAPPAGAPPAPGSIPTPGMAPVAAANAAFGSPSDDLFATEPSYGGGAAVATAPVAAPVAAPASDPLDFGGGSGSAFDDILSAGFGAPSAPAPAPQAPAAPQPAPAALAGGLDDLLSSLGGEGLGGPSPAPAAANASFGNGSEWSLGDILSEAPTVKSSAPKQAEPESSTMSLDDLLGSLGGPSAPAAAPSPQPVAARSSLDDILSGAPPTPAAAGGFDSSLDALLGGGGMAAPAVDDPLAGLGIGDETIIEPTFPGVDLGGFGGGAAPRVAEPVLAAANGLVFQQTFDADPVGQKPASWTGEFAYAKLTVQNDVPPEGSRNYIAYDKREGAGKVYYATKFPNTSGVVSVEFDLRCDDKNKFLLGFYIEKDEDFQQAIHTKILRSESQTAPSIHIHGQPAPYILGAWAHIKYVIDLNEGKVDGYIDGRHVARGITLAQTPKYLNTLAIRDNINTTGQLFIDNIQVQKVG